MKPTTLELSKELNVKHQTVLIALSKLVQQGKIKIPPFFMSVHEDGYQFKTYILTPEIISQLNFK